MAEEERLSTGQCAKEWGVTPRTIERYIKSGKLKAKQDLASNRFKILRSDWEEFKARNLKDVA